MHLVTMLGFKSPTKMFNKQASMVNKSSSLATRLSVVQFIIMSTMNLAIVARNITNKPKHSWQAVQRDVYLFSYL